MELKDINKKVITRISEAPTNLTKKEFAAFIVEVLKEEVGTENITEVASKLFSETYQSKSLEWNKEAAKIVKDIAGLTETWKELGKINNTFYATTAQSMIKAESMPGLVDSINFELSERKVISIREAGREGIITILSDTLKEPKQVDGEFVLHSGWSGFLTYVLPTETGLSFRVLMASELSPLTIREDVAYELPIELLILGFNKGGSNLRRAAAIEDKEHLEEVRDILDKIENLENVDLGFNSEEKHKQIEKIITSFKNLGFELKGLNIVDTLRLVNDIETNEKRRVEVSELNLLLIAEGQKVVGIDNEFNEMRFVKVSIMKDRETGDVVLGAIETDKSMQLSPIEFGKAKEQLTKLADANYESMVKKLTK